MKFIVSSSVLLWAASTTHAFVVVVRPNTVVSTKTALAAVTQRRPDATAAIQAALEASRTYGATSPEARIAWENVEELDASDNSAATKGTLDDECDWLDESNRLCLEYDNKKEQLAAALQAFQTDETIQASLRRMKTLAGEMQAIKLATAAPSVAASTPAVQEALEQAKQAQATYGAGSPEAKMAWETLEELAAASVDASAVGKRLDEECLVESAMEACLALEELNRVLNLEKTKGDAGLNS